MDKQEFIIKMSALDIECILLDDYLINPNEIILLTQKKECLISVMQRAGISRIIYDEGRMRSVRITTYSEMGISQWKNELKRNGMRIGQKMVMPCEEDVIAYFLYYAFIFVQTPNWLSGNIEQTVMERLKLSSLDDLEEWLGQYIKEKNYKIEVKNIVTLPPAILKQFTTLQKCIFRVGQIRLKIVRKLRLQVLRIKGTIHNRSTEEKYISYLRRTNVLGENWSMLSCNGAGSSGCTLIKEECGDATFFVKGNELPLYEGLRNEIIVQKRLLEVAEDYSWFLPMIDSDPSYRWIRYEYVTWDLLSKYKEVHSFTRSELDLLGEYLVNVLDNLHSMGLVHNDLRCENIFVKTKADGTVESFVLTDFGCSSMEGSFPWKKRGYWGNYLARAVCGKMRYNENIVDDAAAALLVYLSVGGRSEDSFALKMRERIGRLFFVCE